MRKKRSLFNIIFSLGSFFITMIFTFITQAMIVKILGIEYSGVNGLFTNVLTMLSVAELGIGNAIIFKLYKPLAKGDKEKIKSWMKFYKICYRYVALFVFIVGIVIIPFIPLIVNKTTINDNIIILYVISFLDVVFSYIMTYKRSLLYADQKNYVINIIHMGYVILMNICQIVVLLLFKKYLLFLIVKLIYRCLENIIINLYVNKNYPYIKEKANNIDLVEKKDIFERVRAIFLQKVSFVINKGIDNIIISLFLGVTAVGYYTNYNLVANTLCSVIYQVMSGFLASIGNMLIDNNSQKNYKIYLVVNLINSSLTAICIVGFICCIQPFINIWLGNSYLLPMSIVISFGIFIYSDSIRRSITLYKEAAGICKEDKYVYVAMAIINLILSIVLCLFIGISGVILGTAFSYLFLIFYSYPKYIFKRVFNKKAIIYYKEKFLFIFIIIVSSVVSFGICNLISFNSILQFVFNGIIASLITSIIIIITFKKKEEFIYLKDMAFKHIKKGKI